MNVKIINLLEGHKTLTDLFNRKQANGVIAFKVSEIIKESEIKLANFNEVRDKLLKDNGGVYDEGSSSYKFENLEQEQNVQKEFTELLNNEVELKATPLTMLDLEKIDSISPKEMLTISWAVKN